MIKNSNELLEFNYLKQLFDTVRVVDPVKKIVVKENGKEIKENIKCFKLCNREAVCENCISIRAYNEDSSFIKFEYINNKVFMIMATPFDKRECNYVIETIKDVTNFKIINGMELKTIDEIQSTFNEMNKLIVTDELTECYNRRYINERLPVDINLAQSSNSDLSIAMVDIDYFKEINDKYGHLAGDFVLKEVSKIIKNNIRVKSDWIARYGGEEFLIVFNGTSKESAYNLLNRVKSIVEKSKVIYNDIEINLTVSIGVSNLSNETVTMDQLINKADKNLYRAKNSGRNIICI